jgi:hypothetical protein
MRERHRAGAVLLILALGAGSAAGLAGQASTAADPSGFRLLERLVSILVKAASPGAPGNPQDEIISLAHETKGARDAQKVDDVFAARFSRLLSVARIAVNPAPQPSDWPMIRFLMMDFIEQTTGRMPEWKDVLANIEHHGGPGIGLALLADAILSEVVSLHIHLRTLPERPSILKSYMDKGMAAPTPSPDGRISR